MTARPLIETLMDPPPPPGGRKRRRYQREFDAPHIEHLYRTGMSVQAVARFYKTNWPMIQRILDSRGVSRRGVAESLAIKWRSRPPKVKIKRHPAELPEVAIAWQYEKLTSIRRLAARYQVSPAQITRVLERQEVPLRTTAEALRLRHADTSPEARRAAVAPALQASARLRLDEGQRREQAQLAQAQAEPTPLEAQWCDHLQAQGCGPVVPMFALGGVNFDLALPGARVGLEVASRLGHSRRRAATRRRKLAVAAAEGWVVLTLYPRDADGDNLAETVLLLQTLARR